MSKGVSNKRYTPEFKMMVVDTMHKEGLSYRESARQFDAAVPHQRLIHNSKAPGAIFLSEIGSISRFDAPNKLVDFSN